MRQLITFLSLSSRKRWLFIQYAISIPCIELSLRLFGFNRTYAFLSPNSKEDFRLTGDQTSELVAMHKCIVSIASRYPVIKGRCLSQSLCLWSFLKKNGLKTELIFGQNKKYGDFKAHAWIEHEGRPINTRQTIRQSFTAFKQPIQQVE